MRFTTNIDRTAKSKWQVNEQVKKALIVASDAVIISQGVGLTISGRDGDGTTAFVVVLSSIELMM